MTATTKESVLTCVSLQQAQDVIDHLFNKQLISRAEVLPSALEDEVKIILENLEEDVRQIRQEVTTLLGREDALQEL